MFWLLFGLVVTDFLRYVGMDGSFFKGTNVTYLMSTIQYVSAYFLLFKFFKVNSTEIQIKSLFWLKFWLGINLFSFCISLFNAETYFDWKYLFLNGVGFSIVPIFFFVGVKIQNLEIINNFLFKRLFLFGFLFIPIAFVTNLELYSRLVIPCTFLLLFLPSLPFKRKILILTTITAAIIVVLDFRSFQLKIALALGLVVLFWFPNLFKRIKFGVHKFLFLLPILFLVGAVYFDFNVFDDGLNQNSKREYKVKVGTSESDLLADTRTFLYLEVFASMSNLGDILIGKGISGSYQSSFFRGGGGDERGKRYGSEVGILNIFLKYGLIGVLIYFFVVYKITDNALRHSKSNLVKLLALLLATRWPLMFVEEFTQYDLNFAFFWLFMGFISSNRILSFNDTQIKELFKRKINVKYLRIT